MNILLLLILFIPSLAFSADINDRRIPDEYESVGADSLGYGNTGVAVNRGLSAIRLNPALLSLEKKYQITAGYNWPSIGRPFYQAGIIDSKTSNVAAGLIYTGFLGDYNNTIKDSPVKRRINFALSQILKKVSLGLGIQYVEALTNFNDKEKIKGTSINLGALAMFTPKLVMGVSVENLANSSIDMVAPRFVRAGLSYYIRGDLITVNLDYQYRERVPGIETAIDATSPALSLADRQMISENNQKYSSSEQMITGSLGVKVYNMVKLMAGFGQSVSSDVTRQSLSGGIAIIQNTSIISYTMSRPYLNNSRSHQAVNLSFSLSL